MPRPQAGGFQVVGLRQAVRDLESVGVEVQDLKDAFGPIGQDVADEAIDNLKAHHVIRTGGLVKSVKASKAKNKAVVKAGTARVWWAAVVDRNPDNHRGTGFLTRPANSNVQQRIDRLMSALNDLTDRFNNGGTTA